MRARTGAAPCISRHVRKDEAALGTKAQHLWPCAERREQGRPWPAAAGRGTDRRLGARTPGQGWYGAGRGAAGTRGSDSLGGGAQGRAKKSERDRVSVV